MIKYIGSKRVLLPRILQAVAAFPRVRKVLDLFSGTSRVGHALKAIGYDVVANDHLAYAHVLARCYIQADALQVREPALAILAELSALEPSPGWFTENYALASRYFRPENAARIEAQREWIAKAGLPPDLEAVALTAVMEAADRVDSTTGVQMAFLKSWAARSRRPLTLRLPAVLPGSGLALSEDAEVLAQKVQADLVYLDPPYNHHRYLGNYHIWETLVRWDRPEVYGVARKRTDCRTFRSAFNSRPRALGALERVLDSLAAPHIILSFSDEGSLDRESLQRILERRRAVACIEVDHARYIGARIGIHDREGRKVGQVSHLRNKEWLFLASSEPRDLEEAVRTLAGDGVAFCG